MPTSNASAVPAQSPRDWLEFAYHSYARIVARKHNLVVPEVDVKALSDEELERRSRLMSELAHLPPG